MHQPSTFQVRRFIWLVAFCCAAAIFARGQARDVVCQDGYGKFGVKFPTGVIVFAGAAKDAELSKRTCEATLAWDKQELVVVPEASEVDIDVLGVDLGLGTPVVAFEIRKAPGDLRSVYQIYSLKKPPRLLRTISAGDLYSAADTDLDGRIEIWTGDAGAVDGLDNLTAGELDFAPTVVLRFENGRLARAQLNPQELIDFKHSDGRLQANSSLPVEQAHRLRVTKVKVLEIVWSYLYSGREPEAWHALADMWPPADLERIRASLMAAQARGVRAVVDGVSAGTSRMHLKKFAYIYETAPTSGAKSPEGTTGTLTADIKPQPILIRRPPPPDTQEALPDTGEALDLLIDAAGKVRSSVAAGKADAALIIASKQWKFIPAFARDGRPVASRMHFVVKFLR